MKLLCSSSRTFHRFVPVLALLLLGTCLASGALAEGSPAAQSSITKENAPPPTSREICKLIEATADTHSIPKDFFARLIWKESHFNHRAVSPVGALGIAQFMPYTAKERGLADPFDIKQAIPASAHFLSDLRRDFGNWGLAAAAYNAGPGRVSRWKRSGGFLPLETEDYVLDLTGLSADNFASGAEITNRPLDPKLPFIEACELLPVIRTATIPMARIKPKPWGIQVAGNFRRNVAVNQWERLRKQFPSVLAAHHAVISRVRTPIARRGIYAVRIGADSRKEADQICGSLRVAGGSCIVLRNR